MKTYGLIGEYLDHSFSKDFFTHKFTAEDIDARYENFALAHISEVESLLKWDELDGLNVTVPYKVAILTYLDELSEEARKIGAVNTVQFLDGKKIGHNTDAFGFAQSIKPFLTFQHERAIVLGTGGASKAISYVLDNLGIDVIKISRIPKGEKQFGYDEVNDNMLRACKLVVNATPVGTFPEIDKCPQFPFEFLTEEHLVIDLIYNPNKTKFLRHAEENGAVILNGRPMLEHQALKAWEIWNTGLDSV
ncbi:MAG: shikimate dehydrogenase [Crocinitomicaceae bacterium]|jgi:shikimate dehydrogenase|nr:shikimate dehydrogenase [Crocinitomicaceae bacterium]